MGDADEPKINPVAAMENWKAAVIKERAVASCFEGNWGYLRAKPEECKVGKHTHTAAIASRQSSIAGALPGSLRCSGSFVPVFVCLPLFQRVDPHSRAFSHAPSRRDW